MPVISYCSTGPSAVHHDLIRALSPLALGELERAEAELARVEPDAEGGRPAVAAERLAVLVDEAGRVRVALEVDDPASRGLHLRQCLDFVEEVGWDRRPPARGEVDELLAVDDGVRTRVRLAEDPVERLLDGVGEDVGAADHRDAEDDGQRGQEGAKLSPRQPLERDPGHLPLTSSIAWRISRAEEGPRSFTIRPSARKRTRSAIAAAWASWVTMTVVCP